MPERRTLWEERYADPNRTIGKPSEFVESAIVLANNPSSRALDLACGSGRHTIALARRGYAVTAVDLAFGGLQKLRRGAAAEGLDVDALQADLEQFPLPTERFDIVVKAFYLQRDLFSPLKSSLVAGGIAIVETFLVDQREIGHPRNPAFLLERGELRERFDDFEILACNEGLFHMAEERAYLARLAARKPRPDRH